MDRYLQYIADQKRKERKQIERSTAALAELDRMERHYLKSGAAALAIHAAAEPASQQTTLLTDADSVKNINLSRLVAGSYGGTLKERILSLLRANPKGLVSQEILVGLRNMGDPTIKRTTISPQLSRLKQDGTLVNVGGNWRMPTNDEAMPSVEDMAK